MRSIYTFGIYLYGFVMNLAARFHPKARKWVKGRRNWQQQLAKAVGTGQQWIWFHCASLGEFEQGRNLIEAIKSQYPHYRLLVSFFSPSGYEVRKNYAHADYVCYLPLDTPANARQFLDIVQPRWAAFIKYELWLNLLEELAARKIPHILVSARMQPGSPFLKSWLAPLYRRAFNNMKAIFTQDEATAQLLARIAPAPHIQAVSDTRYDRVMANKAEFKPIPEIAAFKGDRLCVLAGSSWYRGEQVLLAALTPLWEAHNICLIIAPHEIHHDRIHQWMELYPGISLKYSEIDQLHAGHRMLWIDNVGMLARLYHYADIAYVGGGWKNGLHNILEAAVFGCPVIIGPRYDKFPEAVELIAEGGAFSVDSIAAMQQCLLRLITQEELRHQIKRINEGFVAQRAGATARILQWCQQQQLLQA